MWSAFFLYFFIFSCFSEARKAVKRFPNRECSHTEPTLTTWIIWKKVIPTWGKSIILTKKGLKKGLCPNTDVKKHVFLFVKRGKSPYLCNILKTIFLP